MAEPPLAWNLREWVGQNPSPCPAADRKVDVVCRTVLMNGSSMCKLIQSMGEKLVIWMTENKQTCTVSTTVVICYKMS